MRTSAVCPATAGSPAYCLLRPLLRQTKLRPGQRVKQRRWHRRGLAFSSLPAFPVPHPTPPFSNRMVKNFPGTSTLLAKLGNPIAYPMIAPDLSLAVAKVLIAAAWVDGVIQPEEESFLHDFISRMPGIAEESWEDLRPMLERPVYEAERIRLLRDMRNLINDQKDRRFAIQAINQLFISDGKIAPEEEEAVRQMVSIVNGDESAVYQEMIKMIQRLAS